MPTKPTQPARPSANKRPAQTAPKKPTRPTKSAKGRSYSSAHTSNRLRRLLLLRRVAFSLLVVAIVASTIAYLVLRSGAEMSIAENAVGSLFSPVQSAFTSVTRSVTGFFTNWRSYDKLQDSYDDLYHENQQLSLQLASAEEAILENERLKDVLDARDRYESLDPVYAKVIARDPGRWFDVFTVNRGSTDGISVGMSVVTGSGLVGRVTKVGLNFSIVLSIIDPQSAVACLISSTRNDGVMRGQISQSSDDPDCYIYYLPNTNSIVPGDVVITSGMDSLYPKGIAIGEVSAVSRAAGSEGNYVVVTPYVDFQHIEEVLILRTPIETADEVLPSVVTPSPRPIVTPTPTMPSSISSDTTPSPTLGEGGFGYPTPTPNPSAPIDFRNIPEDSWAG